MVETHPFGSFVPVNTRYLILGSFTGKRTEDDIKNGYDWFYGNKRNQFWPIMEKVYGIGLQSKKEKQELFTRLRMAIADVILSCERKVNNNLDINLTNMVFNTEAIINVLEKNKIKSIFFSSRFAEHLFKRQFKNVVQLHPEIELVTLPSPSPRYAAMSKSEKVARYKELLPRQ